MGLREILGHLVNHQEAMDAKGAPPLSAAPMPQAAPAPLPSVAGSGSSAGYALPQLGHAVVAPPAAQQAPAHPSLMHQMGVGLQNVHTGADEASDVMKQQQPANTGGVAWAAQPQLYPGLAQAMRR